MILPPQHGHFDHHNAVNDLIQLFKLPIYSSRNEADEWIPNYASLSLFDPLTDVLLFHNRPLQIYSTPGHSPGGICIEIGSFLFTGDTLFINGCGRCDLDHSDVNDMYSSLERLKSLTPSLIVLPGHDYGAHSTSTIAKEVQTNRFLTCSSRAAFVRLRMAKRT